MFEIFLAIVFIILAIGSYTDLKTREVPDWVSYSGIIAGLGLRLLWSAAEWNPEYILNGILGFTIFFGLACAMFYLGQWGGGDSKILMAMGALLGVDLSFNHPMIAFLINLLFIGGLYGFAWMIFLGLKNSKKVLKESKNLLKTKHAFWGKLLSILFLIVFTLLALITKDNTLRIPALLLAILPLFSTLTILFTKAVEKTVLIRKVPISVLTEGDWVLSTIKHKGKLICSEKDLGISKKQINQLKRFKIKSVIMKEGIPFIPGFLIAYITTLLVGNIIFLFI